MLPDRIPVEYLVLPEGWGPGSPGPAGPEGPLGGAGVAALAAELRMDAARLLETLGIAAGGVDPGEAVRLPVDAPGGWRLLVAVAMPAAARGPGSPSAQDRCLEAGLRLGAAAPGGRIWGGADAWAVEPSGGGAPDADDAARRDALWRGAYLGAQRPGAAAAARVPSFADGVEPSPRTVARAESAAWVRELTERPPNLLGPAELAAEIAALVAAVGVGVSVETWSSAEVERRGFGALAAVGGGSARPPVAVRLSWGDAAAPAERVLGMVGKGIVFDSGGVNLKRDPGELAWMKSDMAAAAAVAAALVLASRLGDPPRGSRVEAVLPICDNAVSGAAVRPGDVVRHPGGETTEVVDTDCEGRLVLADGISWCRSRGYGRILDAGTLTDGGAGLRRTGLWSNDAELAARLCALGDGAADPLWPLPLPYGEQTLRSRVADRRNAPMDRPDLGRHAAVFLAEIAGRTPWAHYDIGGTAYLEHPIAGWPEGPSGAATVALAEAAADWARGREARPHDKKY